MDKVRETAAKIIAEVTDKGAYANIALAKAIEGAKFDDRDRRFLTELVYGSIKATDTVDFIIKKFVSRPQNKIPPMIRALLKEGAYQIFFMDKVPPSAAVNETVNIAKKYAHLGTVKFVNAVLRNMARGKEEILADMADEKRPVGERLAFRYFAPQWLVEHWCDTFGAEETAQMLEYFNREPKLTLRANALKISREELTEKLAAMGVVCRPSEIAAEGIVCENAGGLKGFSPLRDGLCYVQSESSMLVARVAAPKSGDFVIDACAAPGGKATHMAEIMGNKGKIVAADIYEHKLKLINDNAKRLGIDIIETLLVDARELYKNYADAADVVLVDAPCSGLGVLGHKADLRHNKSLDDLKKFPPLQRKILTKAAQTLKVGGKLVYSTCTVEDAENLGVVKSFLAENENFVLIDADENLPKKIADGDKVIRLYPHRHNTDGFFIACMRKDKE